MEKSRKMITRSQFEKEKLQNKIKIIAKQLFKDMGIKLHCVGFKYWLYAVSTVIDTEINNRQEPKIMQLYYLIAREYKTNVNNVRKAMSYVYKDLTLNKYFSVSYKIDNAALLFLLKDTILKELKTIL